MIGERVHNLVAGRIRFILAELEPGLDRLHRGAEANDGTQKFFVSWANPLNCPARS